MFNTCTEIHDVKEKYSFSLADLHNVLVFEVRQISRMVWWEVAKKFSLSPTDLRHLLTTEVHRICECFDEKLQ